jgi:hypothetical protein
MTVSQILVAILMAAAPETAPVTLVLDESQHIVEGHAFELNLQREGSPVARVEVKANYRQNALESLQQTRTVGITDASGRVVWTPTQAGVVTLEWEGGTKNVAVRYDGAPGLGIVVMILAGILLLGGTICFFLQMARGTS